MLAARDLMGNCYTETHCGERALVTGLRVSDHSPNTSICYRPVHTAFPKARHAR